MDVYARQLRRESTVKKDQSSDDFKMFPANLTLTGSEFQRVGAVTEKAIVPKLVSDLGTKTYIIIRRLKLSGLSCRSEQ